MLWGVAQIAAHRTIYPAGTWKLILVWSTWLAVFFVAFQILSVADVRRRFLCALAVFGFILSIVATVQRFAWDGKIFWLFPTPYPDFVLGAFTNRNQYAAFMELLLPIAPAQLLRTRRRAMLWGGMAAAMFASVIASASRAGVIIATLEVLAVLVLAAVRGTVPRRIAIRTVGSFAAMAAVFTIVVGWDVMWKRFTEHDPFAGRREMLLSSLQMVSDRPAMGFGLGTWAIAYPRYALYDDGAFVNQAHNDWVQWTAECGIPLLLIVLALVLGTVRPALRSLWGLGLLAMLAHALVDYPFQQRPALGAWFFVLLGALAASGRVKSEALLE